MASDRDETSKKSGLIARTLRGATAGAIVLLFQGTTPAGAVVQPILDRARQRRIESGDAMTAAVEQLVMQPAGGSASTVIAGHRSHSSHVSHKSHSSHASHYSGGGRPTPGPAPVRAPEPEVPRPRPPRPPPSKKTTLQVKATPQARVLIDGKPCGTTPTAAIVMEIGKKEVEIQLEHKVHGTTKRTVTLEPGKDNVVDILW